MTEEECNHTERQNYCGYVGKAAARGGAVGWGTALQVGRSRARLPMVSLKFLIYIILTAGMFHGGQRRPKRRADLTTFISRLS